MPIFSIASRSTVATRASRRWPRRPGLDDRCAALSGPDSLLERLELRGGDLHADGVLIGAADGVAIRDASAGAGGCRLLLRLGLLPARDAGQPEAFLLGLVLFFVRLLVVVLFLVAARQPRRPRDVHRELAGRLRVARDGLLVAGLDRGLLRQLLVRDLFGKLLHAIPRVRM